MAKPFPEPHKKLRPKIKHKEKDFVLRDGWEGTVVQWDKALGRGIIHCSQHTYPFHAASVQFDLDNVRVDMSVFFNKKLTAQENTAINIRMKKKIQTTSNPLKLSGQVTFYDEKRHYGFIYCNNLRYYVNQKGLNSGETILKLGWDVRFSPGINSKGRIATSVEVFSKKHQVPEDTNHHHGTPQLISKVYNSTTYLTPITHRVKF